MITAPIFHVLILILLTITDAWIDFVLIKKRKNVHTVLQYVIRFMMFLALSMIFNTGGNYFVYSFILSLIVYWWTFDTAINLLRGKPLYYLSDRGIDAIQPKEWYWWATKLMFAIGASLYFFKPELYEIR